MGVVIWNCSCLANDISKIFEVYWSLGVTNSKIPDVWPPELETQINVDNPVPVTNANHSYSTYISVRF